MVIRSLLAEIAGALPADDGKAVADVASGKRLIVIFEDTLGALRTWQNDLLKTDQQRLRDLNIAVACIPKGEGEALLNGHPATLPVSNLRDALNADGRFEIVLLGTEGGVLLRSNEPVSIDKISEAIALTEAGQQPKL